MNEEYTYDIGKYTIGIDNNGEDGIGLTVAIINDDGEIHFLGNCYGDNARCIDLLIKENQHLKDNWNKLRKWIVYNKHNENTEQHYLVVDYETLLDKMRELEQGIDNK